MTGMALRPYPRRMTKGLQYSKTFVIQFRGLENSEAFSGRVEHVASGAAATFQSFLELQQIILNMLRNEASTGAQVDSATDESVKSKRSG